MLVLLWLAESWLLDYLKCQEQQSFALRDLEKNEYLTRNDIKGPGASKIIGKFLVTEKHKGQELSFSAVATRPSFDDKNNVLVPLSVSSERSLGEVLSIGACVDVWNAAAPISVIAKNLQVLSIIPTALDGKRRVFFAVPASTRTAGELMASKEPALVISQCPSQEQQH